MAVGAVLLVAAVLPAQVHRGLGVSDTLAFFTDPARLATGGFAANPWFACDTAALNAGGSTSPYLYYMLDEASTATTAVDSSGNNRNGTYGGGKTGNEAKACVRDTGTAMTFNGSSGYLASPNLAAANFPGVLANNLNTFSISVWFRTSTTRGGKLVGLGSSNTSTPSGSYDRHLYMANNGAIYFGVYPNVVRTVSSPAGLNDGAWHHAVATLSTAGMRLYVDGALVGSDPGTTTAQQGYVTAFWRVGHDNLASWTAAPTSAFFAGTLDEVSVHNTVAFSAATVQQMYRAGK